MPRTQYSPEFKRKLVEEHLKGGKSVAAICREDHVGEVASRRWRDQYQAGETAATQSQAELARELTAAQRRTFDVRRNGVLVGRCEGSYRRNTYLGRGFPGSPTCGMGM